MALLSPLALTQTLPFLPLAQGDIDYQTERRDEPGAYPRPAQRPVHHGDTGARRGWWPCRAAKAC